MLLSVQMECTWEGRWLVICSCLMLECLEAVQQAVARLVDSVQAKLKEQATRSLWRGRAMTLVRSALVLAVTVLISMLAKLLLRCSLALRATAEGQR